MDKMPSEQTKINKKDEDEWINKSMNEYIDGWINGEWMDNQWISMHECMKENISESMNHSMDG